MGIPMSQQSWQIGVIKITNPTRTRASNNPIQKLNERLRGTRFNKVLKQADKAKITAGPLDTKHCNDEPLDIRVKGLLGSNVSPRTRHDGLSGVRHPAYFRGNRSSTFVLTD